MRRRKPPPDGCDCTWPDQLRPACAIHGLVQDCTCGRHHPTMPLLDLGDGLILPAVCRTHKRHQPCRGCQRDAERLAEVVLFGAPRNNRDLGAA